jgi:hypothetical protein
VTNAEEMQVGFHSLVFLYLIPFLVFGAILVFSGLALPAGPRRCYVAILAAIGGLLWLQGDVLIWGYGSLDGSFIDWQREAWKGYVDSSIWLAVLVAAVSWRRHLVPRVRSGVLLLLAIQLGSLLFMNPWAALVLSVKVYPFVVKELLPYQRVPIHVNDQFIGEWVLAERALGSRSIEVPANFFQEEEVVVGFKFPDAPPPFWKQLKCGLTATDLISRKGFDNEQIKPVTVEPPFQIGWEGFPYVRWGSRQQ